MQLRLRKKENCIPVFILINKCTPIANFRTLRNNGNALYLHLQLYFNSVNEKYIVSTQINQCASPGL